MIKKVFYKKFCFIFSLYIKWIIQLIIRETEKLLNKAKDYYQNDKERLREQARNKYRNLSEEDKEKKREYGRNRYHNMSEEKKQELKECHKQRY